MSLRKALDGFHRSSSIRSNTEITIEDILAMKESRWFTYYAIHDRISVEDWNADYDKYRKLRDYVHSLEE